METGFQRTMTDQPLPGPPKAQEEQGFTFDERVKPATWKERLKRPRTVAALALGALILAALIFLERGRFEIQLPPPTVSYMLLPNEGKTDGLPIAIKLNQLAVFMISDPLEADSGATRAKNIVERLQPALTAAAEDPGKTITIDTESYELPAIVLSESDGTQKQVLVRMIPADMVLAGENDAKRLARVWAERLTDAMKVLAFAEAPKFSTGTEFGDALKAMRAKAVTPQGIVTRDSLGAAFTGLTEQERLALETLPVRLPPTEPTPDSGQ